MENAKRGENLSGDMHCTDYGNPTDDETMISARSGASARLGRNDNPTNAGKSKTTAVVLAVLFGPWTWLYTLSLNWRKFLVGLVLFLGASMFLTLGERVIWILQGQLSDPQVVWEVGLVASGILLAAIYIWAIVDTARKPISWYDQYRSK